MAERTALVIILGQVQQLPAGDTLAGVSPTTGLEIGVLNLDEGGTIHGEAGTTNVLALEISGVLIEKATGAATSLHEQVLIPDAAAELYEVPAGFEARIKTLGITNTTGNAVTGVKLYLNGTAPVNRSPVPPVVGPDGYKVLSDNGWTPAD